MSERQSNMNHHRAVGTVAGIITLGLCVAAAFAGDAPVTGPVYVEPGPVVTTTLYADGRTLASPTLHMWRPICPPEGCDVDGATLRDWAARHRRAFDGRQPVIVVSGPDESGGPRDAGLDIVFNVTGDIPAGALDALEAVALYLESQFADPVTLDVDVAFEPMGPTVIGQAAVVLHSVDWTTLRAALVADMDGDDILQDWLPAGPTVPVRWDGGSATVDDVSAMYVARGNYEAVLGPMSEANDIVLNSEFAFDFDPSDGVTPDTVCFQSLMVHELGHVLGFMSWLDSPLYGMLPAMTAVDLFRFQGSDGAGTDWNPDTLPELQTTARLMDVNNPDDDVVTDLIEIEYRMCDGVPYQASHFRRQSPPIGVMDPDLAYGETYYPEFYRASDLAVFDALGWDRVAPASPDLDGDGDVDLDDFALLAECLAGPDTPPTCAPGVNGDFDADGDCDLADFAAFAEVW